MPQSLWKKCVTAQPQHSSFTDILTQLYSWKFNKLIILTFQTQSDHRKWKDQACVYWHKTSALVLTKACSVTAGNRWICFTYSHRSMVSFQTRKITPTPVHEILNYSVRSNLVFKWTWVTRTLKGIWNKWEKKSFSTSVIITQVSRAQTHPFYTPTLRWSLTMTHFSLSQLAPD